MNRVQAPCKTPLLIRTLAAVVVALMAASLGAAPRYKASVHFQVPEATPLVSAVSDSGDMTGRIPNASFSAEEAFLWKAGGSLVRLGTLGGSYSTGLAINDRAQVVGASHIAGNADEHAFLYSDGSMKDLGTLGGSVQLNPPHNIAYSGSSAFGISNNGLVTGRALTVGGESHAFLYSNGVMKDLGVLPGGNMSHGRSVNANGDVTGQSFAGGSSHAFLYTNGQMLDLGTLGGRGSEGLAINDLRQVIGYSDVVGDMSIHAFLYADGAMRDLGTLGGASSRADAINNSGQVVGRSTTGEPRGRAFIYTDGQMYDLNWLVDSGLGGAVLNAAVTISDEGTIFAYGCGPDTCNLYRLEVMSPDSGGGCAAFTGMPGPIDPTLPALLLLALLWMSQRNTRWPEHALA